MMSSFLNSDDLPLHGGEVHPWRCGPLLVKHELGISDYRNLVVGRVKRNTPIAPPQQAAMLRTTTSSAVRQRPGMALLSPACALNKVLTVIIDLAMIMRTILWIARLVGRAILLHFYLSRQAEMIWVARVEPFAHVVVAMRFIGKRYNWVEHRASKVPQHGKDADEKQPLW